MDANQWHILRVSSGAEKRVALNVGVPAYVPHRVDLHFNRKHRRLSRRYVPALPGIVFVRTPDPRSVNTILPAVFGWVRGADRSFLSITHGEFEDMRELEVNIWLADAPKEEPVVPFAVGDTVIFLPEVLLSGQRAVVERLSRNRAFFRLLQSGLIVEADVDKVEKVA
jgi:transcription antitermination factor NusG